MSSPGPRWFRRAAAVSAMALMATSCSGDSAPTGSDAAGPETPESVAAVVLSVPRLGLEPGDSLRASAEVRASDGALLVDREVSWGSSDPSVLSVSSDGLIHALRFGQAQIMATAEGVADTVVLTAALSADERGYIDAPLSEAQEVFVYSQSLEDLVLRVEALALDGSPMAAARMVYWEGGDRHSALFVQGADEGFDSSVAIMGDFQVLIDLLRDTAGAEFQATSPRAEGVVAGAAPLLAIPAALKVGAKVLAAGVFVYRVADRARQTQVLRERNAIIVSDWRESTSQCATLEEVAAFVSNELEQVRMFRRSVLSVGFFALGSGLADLAAGAATGAAIEVGMMVADETIDLLPLGEVTRDDIIEYGRLEFGLPLDAVDTPSGRIAVVLEEAEPIPAGTLAYARELPPLFVGIDPNDDECAGRIGHQLQVGATPASVAPGARLDISAQITSVWANGVPGAEVRFDVPVGHGSLSSDVVVSNADGIATVQWTAPADEGQYEITVSARNDGEHLNGSPVTVTATVSSGSGGSGTLGIGFGDDQFSLIPAGTFQMGSADGSAHERPVHTVTLTRSFYMQRTPVTQGQWREVMGSNPSHFSDCGDTCPVESVSWNDAQAFIQALNERYPGRNYRLPTEAEWEYAARAGTTGDYGGTGVLDEMGWYFGNSGVRTHPVALKQPNAWGLYDMHGNVWESVQDWYGPYTASAKTDPIGPSTGSQKVLRGGSWGSLADNARSASRSRLGGPSGRNTSVGFRLARTP